jgi:prepilin-type N-terminal cleavage/methylation domain-containing protein
MPISPRQTNGVLRPPQPNSTGFTLVEVLVSLVMLAVISAVLARILQGSLQVKTLQRDQIQAHQARADDLALQFSGELNEPLVTLERIEEEK